MCGLFFYGDYLAKHGVRVLAVDLCGYGQSLCQLNLGSDPVFAEGHGYDLLRVPDSTKLTPFAGQVLDWIRP